ncbi:hypothetical protein Fmac_020529 [Flemingia macrophylla]|uniref:DUF3752 domain-containing protein n=1 Tax=Flemingia macrophylla TaxID=520843 RepID=A0ABD1LU94_9FABA
MVIVRLMEKAIMLLHCHPDGYAKAKGAGTSDTKEVLAMIRLPRLHFRINRDSEPPKIVSKAKIYRRPTPHPPPPPAPSTTTTEPSPSFHFNPHDADDIYAELFGSDDSAAASSRRDAFFRTSNGTSSSSAVVAAFSSPKATPVENALPCNLEDLYKGVKKKMKISRNVCDAFGIGAYFCLLLALHGCLATVEVGKLVCHEQTCSLLVSFGKSISMEGDEELLAQTEVKVEPKRDEWMITLPPERKPGGMTMQSTKFSRGPKEGRGDTSAWTDTPLDRAQKVKMKYVS